MRRATAVGDLARRQLTLDLNPTPDAADIAGRVIDGDPIAGRHRDRRRRPDGRARADHDGATRKTRKPRQVVLYVHLSDAAVVPGAPLDGEFGRVENTRGPVHAEQIRQWCGNPDAEITVQPVLDLNEHIDVEAYEIRGRLREQTILTHPTCVFPWCTRPARALEPDEHDADCDHRVPYAKVQHSCSCNTAPLVPAASPGQDPRPAGPTPPSNAARYVWTSPHGYQYLRDHHGTLDVSRDRHPPADPCTHRRTPAPTPRTTDSTAPNPAGPPPAGTSARPGPSRTGCTTGVQPSRPGSPGLDKLDQRLPSVWGTGSDAVGAMLGGPEVTGWVRCGRPEVTGRRYSDVSKRPVW